MDSRPEGPRPEAGNPKGGCLPRGRPLELGTGNREFAYGIAVTV